MLWHWTMHAQNILSFLTWTFATIIVGFVPCCGVLAVFLLSFDRSLFLDWNIRRACVMDG